MQPQPWVVEIGPKEIYDQLVALNTKVELAMAGLADEDRRGQDHETRLRALERARWPLPAAGLLVALASAVTAVVALLTR